MKKFILAASAVFMIGASAWGQGLENRVSKGVVVDTGNQAGGFSVTVSTPSKTLLSASGVTSNLIWRKRTFQVTGTPYNVWMSTFSTGAYGSGAGWYVQGSTGSYTTSSQSQYYGILDPSAGAGTGVIKGPFEFQNGEHP
jgi:hypothetical protein